MYVSISAIVFRNVLKLQFLQNLSQCISLAVCREQIKESPYRGTVTDRYYKLVHAILTSETPSTHVRNLAFDHWLMLFRISTYNPTDNDPQIYEQTLTIYQWICWNQKLYSRSVSPKVKGQTGQIKNTIAACRRHSVAGRSRDYDLLVHLLTSAYKTHTQKRTNRSPHRLVFTQSQFWSPLIVMETSLTE